MANTTWYGDGTATVAVGSRTVTGTDTGWLTAVAGLTPIKAGDKYGIHVGRPIVIEQIISDTELLLADDWPGPAQTNAPYKVELTSPTIAAVEAMRRLLASLSNGNLDSLSEITVGTDDIPIGVGPGVFGTINKAALVQGDVVGPIGGVVSGSFAYYSDTSGKSLGATSKLVATQHQPSDGSDPVLDLRQFGDGWLIRGRTWNNQNYSGLWFDSNGVAEYSARNANDSLLSLYRADRCSVAGPISGTAKNFEIDHPADPENYDLRHCATESPEMLVEYRGIATLVDGRAVVDVERYFGVMENTFANLWIDAWVASLQNQTSFARVMPSSVLGASFEIVCEDGSSEDVIAWHLTARRNDAYVRWSGCPFTDSDGRLIVEFEKEEPKE